MPRSSVLVRTAAPSLRFVLSPRLHSHPLPQASVLVHTAAPSLRHMLCNSTVASIIVQLFVDFVSSLGLGYRRLAVGLADYSVL